MTPVVSCLLVRRMALGDLGGPTEAVERPSEQNRGFPEEEPLPRTQPWGPALLPGSHVGFRLTLSAQINSLP